MADKKKKALLVCYGGGHVAMTIPVVKAMQASGEWEVQVLGLTTARHRLDRESLPTVGFADLQQAYGDARSRHWGERLAEGVSHPLVRQEETIAYLGLNYCDVEAEHGVHRAAEMYREQGRSIFSPVRTLKRWMTDQSPDVVVSTSSPRSERAALRAARQLGIPAVAIVDLHRPPSGWLGNEGLADRLCVFSDDSVDFFIGCGRNPGDVVATGNPAFDSVAAPEVVDAGKALAESRGWGNDGLRILWASQVEPACHPVTKAPGDPALPGRIEAALLEMLPRHPSWELIVRPHPSESRGPGDLPPQVRWSDQTEALHVLLHAVDAVVTSMSTVGLEAALAQKPVVSVDLSVVRSELPLSDMGISRGITDWPSLEQALVEIQTGCHSVRPKLPAAGGAAQRCLRVIDNLIAQRQSAALQTAIAD